MCPDQPRGLDTASSPVVKWKVTGRRLHRKERVYFLLLFSPFFSIVQFQVLPGILEYFFAQNLEYLTAYVQYELKLHR